MPSVGLGIGLGIATNRLAAAVTAATWDGAHKGTGITLSGSNLIATNDGSGWNSVRSTTSKTAKRFFQAAASNAGTYGIGFCNASEPVTTPGDLIGFSTNSVIYLMNGAVDYNGATLATFAAWDNTVPVGGTYDPPTGTVEFFRNGVSVGTVTAAGIGATYYAAVGINSASAFTANFNIAGPGAVAKWDS